MLGLYGLFRHYVETNTQDDDPGIVAARASFMKCCALVDMILDMKNAVTPLRASVPALRQRVAEFFAAHETAYGRNSMEPKHHWIWDFIMNWLDDPMILDALVIERLTFGSSGLLNKSITQGRVSCNCALKHDLSDFDNFEARSHSQESRF